MPLKDIDTLQLCVDLQQKKTRPHQAKQAAKVMINFNGSSFLFLLSLSVNSARIKEKDAFMHVFKATLPLRKAISVIRLVITCLCAIERTCFPILIALLLFICIFGFLATEDKNAWLHHDCGREAEDRNRDCSALHQQADS